MIEKFIIMWFYIIFLGLIPIIYKALTAIDFSNIFKHRSTWQIRFLVTIISITFSYIIALAFESFVSRLISLFTI